MLTYAISKEELEGFIPECLELDTFDDKWGFIDRKGNIQKIRTGFYGPGTGSYYTRYIEQTNDFIAKLLAE